MLTVTEFLIKSHSHSAIMYLLRISKKFLAFKSKKYLSKHIYLFYNLHSYTFP